MRPHPATERAGDEAVAISEALIEAHGTWDHRAATSLVSDTAAISINPARSPEDLEMELAWMEIAWMELAWMEIAWMELAWMEIVWMEATGWVFTATGCSATRGPTKDGAQTGPLPFDS